MWPQESGHYRDRSIRRERHLQTIGRCRLLSQLDLFDVILCHQQPSRRQLELVQGEVLAFMVD